MMTSKFPFALAGHYVTAFRDVEDELRNAKMLHPGDFHNIHEGFAVLREEVDELWDAVKLNPKKIEVTNVAVLWGDNQDDGVAYHTWLLSTKKAKHRKMLREEAIQIAAMAIRFAAELT